MGFRFRRTIPLLRGVRINLAKTGMSVSVGRPGATINLGKRGVTGTIGVPGTGISYSRRISGVGSGLLSWLRQPWGIAFAVGIGGLVLFWLLK